MSFLRPIYRRTASYFTHSTFKKVPKQSLHRYLPRSHYVRSLHGVNFPPQSQKHSWNKIGKTNLWFTALFLGLGFACIEKGYTTENKTVSVKEAQKLTFSQVQQWLQELPEIRLLASSDVKVTQEGIPNTEGNWSKLIFGERHAEFDRTIMNLHCLEMILDGTESAYQKFVAAQTENRLSREQFAKLHEMSQYLTRNHPSLSSEEVKQALKVGVVLGDIGKSKKAKKLFQPYDVDEADHDDFLRKALLILKEHPEIFSSFAKLPEAARDLLVGAEFEAHIGHWSHIEGGKEMFTSFKRQWNEDTAPHKEYRFQFFKFLHICDVAAAAGHINKDSSLAMTSNTFRVLESSFEICEFLASGKDERAAYEALIEKRAEWLNLDPKDQTDRLITRVACMLRLVHPDEKVTILKEAFLKLPEKKQKEVLFYFDPLKYCFQTTNTYLPAALLNYVGKGEKQRLQEVIQIVLPFIVNIFKKHEQMLKDGQIKPEVRLNFNPLAKDMKEAKEKILALLPKARFSIDEKSGEVCLKSMNKK